MTTGPHSPPERSSPQVVYCTECGEPTALPARFCRNCGTRLQTEADVTAAPAAPAPAAPAPVDVRKTVTVVFCDIVDSTAFGERVDPESVRRVVALYFDEMSRVLERHGGVVEKFIGDAVMAVFGIPQLHEDDALRAARAAREMLDALEELNVELEAGWGVRIQNRIGVNTGEVVTAEHVTDQRLVTGDAVNVAARLEQHAQPGQVLIGEATYRLVRDAVVVEPVAPLMVKGKSEPLLAWHLQEVSQDSPWLQRHLDSPVVGREDELSKLMQSFEESLLEASRLVTILAPPGTGKSRMVREFTHRIAGQARVTYGRCLSYGDGVTYWPLAELVHDLAGVPTADDAVRARAQLDRLLSATQAPDAARVADLVAGAIGLDERSASTTEIAWAVRRMLEITTEVLGPLVVVFDDIHWAESALLDLIEHIAMLSGTAPLLVVCMARPELDEVRPGWSGSVRDALRMTLSPLPATDLDVLLENLIEGASFPAALRERIVNTADGNPLFVEELLRMLVDDGLLVRSGDTWRATEEIEQLVVPASVSAILTTRLDMLDPHERAVIQRAAVIGREFYREAITHLTPEEWRGRLDDSLRSLVLKQLIRPAGAGFAGAETFRFNHLLTHDAAYAGIAKEQRAGLHEQFAGWMESTTAGRSAEYAAIIGYHLEQAAKQLRELGRVDVRGRALAARGGQWLSSAGRQALARGDMSAAANLLERASTLLSPSDSGRPRLLRDLAVALIQRGRHDDAERALTEAYDFARASGDADGAELARLDREFVRLLTSPEGTLSGLVEATDEAYGAFTASGNHEGLARVWRLRAEVHWMGCAYGATTVALELALEHARSAEEIPEQTAIIIWLASCLALGPTAVGEAIPRCHDLLAQAGGSRQAEAAVYTVLGYLHALGGEPDLARRNLAEAWRRYTELGLTGARAQWSEFSGTALLLIGDLEDAEAELRDGYDSLRESGQRYSMPVVAASLARVLIAQDRFAEAESLTQEAEQEAAEDDLAAQIGWRAARAICRAEADDQETAETLARAALALAEETDDLELTGFAHQALSVALAARGDQDGAIAEAAEGLAAYSRKGAYTA
ncbi:MAG: adenylate/guanylate cyclase domain-containing protein [Nocardioidaceae bacterium]